MITTENQPRLWFACPKFGGATEVWMYRQAISMKRFDVRVVCRGHANQDAYPASEIEVSEIPSAALPSKLRAKRFWNIIRNAGSGFFDGPPAERQWFSRLWNNVRPDVILFHYGEVAIHLIPLFARREVPIVVHFNGYDLSGHLQDWSYRWRLRAAIPRCAGFVVVADYMRDWLIKNGAPEEKVVKIPYGIPVAEFSNKIERSDNICRFLTVGRFVEKKRPDLTVRAFARCVQECSRAELCMVGDGPLLSECERLAIELGVAEKVRFLGAQPSLLVREQLQQADVFVQHSVTSQGGDKEGWPVAVAEAAASRLPVISTYHASIPEQIAHGQGGLLVQELDWEKMADCMLELATDSNKRREMGNAAYQRIAEFDIEKQVGKLEEFLLSQIRAEQLD